MKKVDLGNFWYYHKNKVIWAVVLIIVIGLIFYLEFTGRDIKADVEIAYVTDGRIISSETEEYLKKSFVSKIEDVNGDKNKETAFVPLQGPRINMEFVAEGSQIVLMDGTTLGEFINSGMLEPLDDFVSKYKFDFSSNPEVNASLENQEEHTYAIPVKYLPFLLKVGFPADDYYLTIRSVLDHKNKTVEDKNRNAHAIMDIILDQNIK